MIENRGHHLRQMIHLSHRAIHYHQVNPSMNQMFDFLNHYFGDTSMLRTILQPNDVNIHQLVYHQLASRNNCSGFLLWKNEYKYNMILYRYDEIGSESV